MLQNSLESEELLRIDSSNIGMESAVKRRTVTVATRRFEFKKYQESPGFGTDVFEQDQDDIQEEGAKEKKNSIKDSFETMGIRRVEIKRADDDFISSFRQYVMKYIMMMLFGEKKTSDLFKDMKSEVPTAEVNGEENTGNQATLQIAPLSMKTMTYVEETYYEEEQCFSFASKGSVHTADGRDLDFNIDINMSESMSGYVRKEMNLADFTRVCDPLVINFNNACAKLSDMTFRFDLDTDGEAEEIAMLSEGSGYLALDKNGDGTINDGSELFGPASGNGFEDLEAYDEDGNGWIDENDTIWDSLKIFCKNQDGSEDLYTLKDKGVGAICLSKVRTDFTYKTQEMIDKGYLRSTGIFLFEDGRAGTMQHLDMVQ